MDEKKTNQALYEKMTAEQGEYRNWLLRQSPEEILKHAHEYGIREDILIEMDMLNLPKDEAAALLKSSTPLADIYGDFRGGDGHMENVRGCIEDLAKGLLKAQREATRSIPLYQQSGAYAMEHGELDAYRSSRKVNEACREAIEAAIRDGYDGRTLNADVKGVLAEFGPERVSYVLAATLQQKLWDERFSRSNQAWAVTVPMYEPQERRDSYIINSHSTLLDGFVSMVRKELEIMREQQSRAEKRPSIKDQLAAKPVPGDQPAKPKDKEAR